MADASAPSDDPWSPWLLQLPPVLQALNDTQQALLNSASGHDPDAFVRQCASLAQALSQLQQLTPRRPWAVDAPGAVRQGIEQLESGLGALADQAARLSARDRRALDLLFPNDGLKAYSRLGRRSPSLGGSAYLKA